MIALSDTLCGGLSVGFSNSLQCTKQGSTHNTEKSATTEKAFKMLGWVDLKTQTEMATNVSFIPYLLDYFIRNRTIHTYKTRQRNDIHPPSPNAREKTFRFSCAVLFNDLPKSVKEATSLSIFKNSYFSSWPLGFYSSDNTVLIYTLIALFSVIALILKTCTS